MKLKIKDWTVGKEEELTGKEEDIEIMKADKEETLTTSKTTTMHISKDIFKENQRLIIVSVKKETSKMMIQRKKKEQEMTHQKNKEKCRVSETSG